MFMYIQQYIVFKLIIYNQANITKFSRNVHRSMSHKSVTEISWKCILQPFEFCVNQHHPQFWNSQTKFTCNLFNRSYYTIITHPPHLPKSFRYVQTPNSECGLRLNKPYVLVMLMHRSHMLTALVCVFAYIGRILSKHILRVTTSNMDYVLVMFTHRVWLTYVRAHANIARMCASMYPWVHSHQT
jgi:hypothetical protein